MKEKIKYLMDKGYLLDPEVINFLDDETFDLIERELDPLNDSRLTVEIINQLKNSKLSKVKQNFLNNQPLVTILKSYDDIIKKVDVSDFVEHYKIRYNFLRKLLQNRIDLSDTISINRAFNKMERERISLIGLVYSKEITKNNNIMLELEDPTGIIKVLITSNKQEVYKKAQDLVLDEVIGITGNMGNRIVFVNDLFFPESPINGNNLKKSENEEYVAFISDLHYGSSKFLGDEFLKFIKWINGETGSSQQKEVAKSVNYLFIVGDIVDGIGVYPGQDEELDVHELSLQYSGFANLLKKIRGDIQIIICPGNHDAIRLAEPQPLFDKKLAKSLYELNNVIIVTNPALINIGSYNGFKGFDVLMYHGYSFDYYIDQIESIRFGGGYDRGDLVMKFLLQKRHLAPSHTSTLFLVDPKRDNLIIEEIPDFFVSGHLHKSSISQFGKTTMICGSCWQSRTAFQDKVGHHPEPCRVPIVNLKTRDVKLMKFCD